MTNEQLLEILRQIESGGGKNFNHPTITHGVSAGTRAIGNYGLTAASVDDVIKNNPQLQALLGQMDPEAKKAFLESHPDVEKQVALPLADRVLSRFGGDPNKAAYAWNHGTYLDPNKITPDMLQKDDYTSKFQKYREKLGIPASQGQDMDIAKDSGDSQAPGMANNGPNMSFEDIIKDPSNPFNQKDDDDTAMSLPTNNEGDEEDDSAKFKKLLSILS